MSMFCVNCQNIIDNLFNQSLYEPSYDPSETDYTLEQRFHFLNSYREVIADSECGLCAFIKEAVLAQLPKDTAGNPKLPNLDSDYPMRMLVSGGNRFRPALKGGRLWLREVMVGTALDIGMKSAGYSTQMLLHFSITAGEGSPALTSGNVLGVGPFADSASAEALSVLEGWVNECVEGHEECRWPKYSEGKEETTKPELPTRVLDIGTDADDATVRLVETKGRRDHYVALSHCWGDPSKRPICTLRANLQDHLAGIPVSKLPKTFRDAVALTRLLKIRFIWIDSCCIIQDDETDWSMEAPRMGSLYNRAYLVIAASSARDSSDGCFVPRVASKDSIKIPFKVNGVRNGDILLTVLDLHQGWPAVEPLGKRAWVLQEWVLARRLVHFTTAGLMWSCHRLRKEVMKENGTVVRGTEVKDWDAVIGQYTNRDLTHLSDKLAAVEGMANEMQGSRKDRYLYGVWTGELPHHLFWIGRETMRLDELRRFPTWSWASTHGACIMWTPTRIFGLRLSVHSECEIQESTLVVTGKGRECLIKKWTHLFQHEHVQEPPFSSRHKTKSISSLPILIGFTVVHHMLDPSTGSIIGMAILDDKDGFSDGEYKCASLLLMREDDDPSTPCDEVVYLALLVRVSDKDPAYYERIGVGFIIDVHWFQGEEVQKFKIR